MRNVTPLYRSLINFPLIKMRVFPTLVNWSACAGQSRLLFCCIEVKTEVVSICCWSFSWLDRLIFIPERMTRPKLYYAQVSPAARSTLLTVAALGLDVERIPVNLMAGEHLTPQYLKVCWFIYDTQKVF